MTHNITNEQVARVFAMYLGCEIRYGENEEASTLESIATSGLIGDENRDERGEGWYDQSDCKLLLTPLHAISDEDAIEVSKLFWRGSATNEERKYLGRMAVGFHFENYSWDYENGFDTAKNRKRISEIGFIAATRIYQYLIQKSYAVPLFFEPGHPDNGKDAIQLGLAIDKTKTK